jgi:hypothetical protein
MPLMALPRPNQALWGESGGSGPADAGPSVRSATSSAQINAELAEFDRATARI